MRNRSEREDRTSDPYRVLLEVIGDGTNLTSAGHLKPAAVEQIVRSPQRRRRTEDGCHASPRLGGGAAPALRADRRCRLCLRQCGFLLLGFGHRRFLGHRFLGHGPLSHGLVRIGLKAELIERAGSIGAAVRNSEKYCQVAAWKRRRHRDAVVPRAIRTWLRQYKEHNLVSTCFTTLSNAA